MKETLSKPLCIIFFSWAGSLARCLQVENCLLMATYEYYAYFYAEGNGSRGCSTIETVAQHGTAVFKKEFSRIQHVRCVSLAQGCPRYVFYNGGILFEEASNTLIDLQDRTK